MSLDECHDVVRERLQRGAMEIHHMTADVLLDAQAGRVDAAVLEHVLRGEVRRGQVVVAGRAEDTQRLVVLGSLRQLAGDVDETGESAVAVARALPLLVRLAVRRDVALDEIDLELRAEVALEQGYVDRSGLGVEGIAVRELRDVVELGLRVAPVQETDRLSL